MAIREMFSVWTSALTLSCLYLSIKDIECSECSDLASLLETPSLTPCQTTTTHVTGSSVVFDFYDSYNLGVDSCSCSVMIPSTTNFELSMYAYYGLGIDSNPGCGSKIEVNSNQSGSQIMECRVFGSISMQTGDQAIVKLTREPNADSRYCMIMSTDPSFIMDIDCEAVGSALPTTTKLTTTTAQPTTTPSATTTRTPTTTKLTTTTVQPTTTTQPPTTTKQTTKTTLPTFTTTTKPIATTTKQKITTTKQKTTTTKPTHSTVKQTISAATTITTTTTTQPRTSTKQFSSTVQSSTLWLSSSTTPSSTTTTGRGKTNVGGQSEDNSNKTLVIIIPVVVGVFFLLLLVVLVTQLAKTCRTKSKQNPEIDMEKIRFGQTFPKNGVFLHPTDMVETTHYDSKEDLHGHNDRYIGVTNPVYIHEEFEYLPEITDLEVANFTSNHDSESGKIISGSNNNNTHDAPLYAVVNKSRTNDYLDFSKMADFSSKSSSDLSGIGMLDENERNLRQEESFHY